MVTEPAPRRHRRRERRRSRPAGTEGVPPGPDGASGTSGEHEPPSGAPVEGPPAGKDRAGRRFARAARSAGPGGSADQTDAAGLDTGGRGTGWARRRSRRAAAGRPDPSGAVGAPTDAGTDGRAPAAEGEPGQAAAGKARPARRPDLDRGLRGIVGAGPSQVGVLGAMRARDAARPTEADLAAAERELVIVRRHYVPPDADPRST